VILEQDPKSEALQKLLK
jgi:uncharacterized protein (DUF2225 family)